MAELLDLIHAIPVLEVMAALLAMNVLCFALFGIDKWQSQRGGWRQPERRLLTFAAVGGAVGGKAAQALFRHKTRKQPFATLLNLALVWNIVAVIGWAVLRLI